LAVARFAAATADNGALVKVAVHGDDAVDWAELSVAVVDSVQATGRADLTTIGIHHDNTSRL
jgi:hypothetical protein